MVRRYTDEPVTKTQIARILDNAVRAPSAGFSQGWSFLVLDRPEDVARYWSLFSNPNDQREEGPASDKPKGDNAWLAGMKTAPALVIPCASKEAYLERYAQPDKGWTDRDESRWSMPYWYMDTAMAVMLMLQTAVDEELGACYFGIPPEQEAAVHAEFGIPAEWEPIGIVTLGHPDRSATPRGAGSPSRRARRTLEEVVHRGHW